ncbi:hypothetical protein KAH37_07845 [bacterium]|nr:hypothetical protein [bacterium]
MKKIVILLLFALSLFGCSSDSFDTPRKLVEPQILGVQLTSPLPAVGETLHVKLALYPGTNPSDNLAILWNINNLTTVGESSFALDLSADSIKTLLTAAEQKELSSKGEVHLLLTAALVDRYTEENRETTIEIPFTLTSTVDSNREENPILSSVECDEFAPDNKPGEITHYTIPLATKKVVFVAEIESVEDDSDSRILFLDWNIGWSQNSETFPDFERNSNKITLYPPQDNAAFNGGDVTLFTLVRTNPAYSHPILFEFEEIHITFQ